MDGSMDNSRDADEVHWAEFADTPGVEGEGAYWGWLGFWYDYWEVAYG